MTVIAWDGITLAADKMCGDEWMKIGTVTKVRRIGECLVGCAGNSAKARAMLKWFEDGADPNTLPAHQLDDETAVTLLVIRKNGQAQIYQASAFPINLEQKFVAVGSGREAAMATMHLGFGARRAVEVASAVCQHCGNGIDTLTLG